MSGRDSVEVSRILPAPIDEVFSWWTQAARMREWMSPIGTVEVEVDLRIGGQFRVVMRDGDVVINHSGEYVEVDPPRRLVFTWASPYTGPEPSVVTVELEPDGADATRFRLVHSELPEGAGASHQGGWGSMLDRLAGVMTEVKR